MFKFSLQAALNVRSRQEKIKMKEMAEVLAIEKSIMDNINRIHEETEKADFNLDELKKSGTFNIEQMRFLFSYKKRMKVVLTDCHVKLGNARIKVAEKQKELIEASRARKTLEILKEKEEKRFKAKISRLERKSMDEIAGNIFIRNINKARA